MRSQRSLSGFIHNPSKTQPIKPLVSITQVFSKKLVRKQDELKSIYNSQRSLIGIKDMKSIPIIKDVKQVRISRSHLFIIYWIFNSMTPCNNLQIQFSNKTLLKQITELKSVNCCLQKQIESIHQTYKNTKVVELQSQIKNLENQIQNYQTKLKYLEGHSSLNQNKKTIDDNTKLQIQVKQLKSEIIEMKTREQSRNYDAQGIKKIDENLKTQVNWYKDKIIEQDFQLDLLNEQNIQILSELELGKQNQEKIQQQLQGKQQEIYIFKSMVRKYDNQIQEYHIQEEVSQTQKQSSEKDIQFLKTFLTKQKNQPENRLRESINDLMISKQQRILLQGKKEQGVLLNKMWITFSYKLISIQELPKQSLNTFMKVIFYPFLLYQFKNQLEFYKGRYNIFSGTFKIVDFNNALIVARFLVEIDKPITDIHQKHDVCMIYSILKKNVGEYALLNKSEQIDILVSISNKIRPKRHYIENWIMDIDRKRDNQGIITWDQLHQILDLQSIHLDKEEFNFIGLQNYEITQLINQINIQVLLKQLFQFDICPECEPYQQQLDDCGCLVKQHTKDLSRQSFQNLQTGVKKLLILNRLIHSGKQKAKEI